MFVFLQCNEDDLHTHFKSFGDIKDIQLLRRPDKKLVGCGFVEYVSRLSAKKAAEQLNGKEFLGWLNSLFALLKEQR